MTADDFTNAARAEAEDYARTPRMNVGTVRDRIAEAYLAGAEWARAHLAAQDLQVTIQRNDREPAMCEVRQGGVLIFSGLDRSADVRVAAQEPTDAEVLAALNADYAIRHPLTNPSDTLDDYGDWTVDMMRAALRAARDVRAEA